MGPFFVTVVWALCTFTAITVYRAICSRIATAEIMRQYGCMESKKYPHIDPILGLDLFIVFGRAMKQGRMLDMTKALFTTYGRTFEINSWGTKVLNTAEPRNIQTVLALSFDNFGVEPVYQKETGGSFMAKGIFTADGPVWARSRALIKPTFVRSQISNFASLEEHVNRLFGLIPRDGSTVDLQPLIKRLFLDTSTEFLFGESVGSLSQHTPFDSIQFLSSFDTCMRGLAARMQLGKFKFIRGRDKAWKEAIGKVHAFIDNHVAAALRQRDHELSIPTGADMPWPARYILLTELVKETQDIIDLRYQLLHVFFPAHDATGIAVSDIIFHLARDPRRWDKLRSEILRAASTEPLSFELLKSMTYLRYIFNESLRLHPLAGRLRRNCHKDTILPLGGGSDGKEPILVRRGTSVVMNIHAMHHDKELWGDNADDFCPERWNKIRPSWEYLPFSGGPRICPAQQMVYTEAAYIIVRLVQEFQRIENQDPEPWTERFRMTVESKNGVKVKVTPA